MKFKSMERTNKFLKLNDGDSVTGVFVGDPCEFRQHFVDGKSEVCDGNDCVHCQNGQKSSFRFRVNFIDVKDFAVYIFEQGKTTYQSLENLDGAIAPLEKTLIKITRTGTALSTRYILLGLGVVPPEVQAKLHACLLHPLEHRNPKADYVPGPLAQEGSFEDFKDIPF